MIQLIRVRTPEAVPAKYRGEKRIEKARSLVVTAGTKHTFDSTYWTEAKKQLRIKSVGKCAYCETNVLVAAHGDVEHFRPKSTYWWLAYCYDNYLFACQICNQTYKSDHFPVSGAPLPAPVDTTHPESFAPDPLDKTAGLDWAVFAQQKVAEKADLVNPYEEDPEALFAWEKELNEIHLKAEVGERAERAFSASEQYLGLNRETLRKDRYDHYKIIKIISEVFQSPNTSPNEKEEAAAILKEAVSGEKRYTGMCRYFIRKVWNLPF